MTSLLPIITLVVSIIIPLLLIIAIITYNYVLETGQLAEQTTSETFPVSEVVSCPKKMAFARSTEILCSLVI